MVVNIINKDRLLNPFAADLAELQSNSIMILKRYLGPEYITMLQMLLFNNYSIAEGEVNIVE